MATQKLLHGRIDLSKPEHGSDLDMKITKALADAGLVSVTWSVLWTAGVTAALIGLDYRVAGGPWQRAISEMMSDLDGEMSVAIGSFPAGTQLEFAWAVSAISSEIPKAATFAIADTSRVFRLAPPKPTEFQKIARTEIWEGTAKYTVTAEVVA